MKKYSHMRFLLHASDFHIREDYLNKDNTSISPKSFTMSAFNALANKLREEHIQVDYLIHTGDVIDASDMAPNRDNGKKRKERYYQAKGVFDNILSELNVPAGNVIICCGNHDIARESRPENPECAKSPINKEVSETHNDSSFSSFESFVEKLKTANFRNNHNNTGLSEYCTLGEMNVLILNTNWPAPKNIANKNQHCVHCTQVCNQIDQYMNDPSYQKDNLNIIIAHKPLYEICEQARLPYHAYQRTGFMSKIHSYLGENGIYLCGDKHTRSMIGTLFHDIPHYLSGEPLYEFNKETKTYEAEYNLLGIADGKLAVEWKIHLRSKNGQSWTCDIRPQDATVAKLYKLSHNYISPICYKYLSIDNLRNTWDIVSQSLYTCEHDNSNERHVHKCTITTDTAMDKMFKSLACYQTSEGYNIPLDAKSNDLSKNIFVVVSEQISEKMKGKYKNILNLRGAHSTGKSSFLGLLYIHLLRLYSLGVIDFIPAYFALESETMLKKVRKSSTYYQAVKEEFADFAKSIQKISKKECKNVCYIIDRIDNQDFWSYSSEDSVGRAILDILSKYENAWYIFSRASQYLPHFKRTLPPRTRNDKSDVIFFNPIELYKVASNAAGKPVRRPEFTDFVSAFLEKHGFLSEISSFYAQLNTPASKPDNVQQLHKETVCDSDKATALALRQPYRLVKRLIDAISHPKNHMTDAIKAASCKDDNESRTKQIEESQNESNIDETFNKCIQDICTTIEQFRRLDINPSFMRQHYDFLTAHTTEQTFELKHANTSVSRAYEYYIDRQLERCLDHTGYDFVHFAPAMAYLFSYRGFTYEQFIRIKNDPKLCRKHPTAEIAANQEHIYKAFLFISKHDDAREYLVALHYHRELRYYTEHPDEPIPDDSILTEYLNRNIAILIRKGWTDVNKFIIVCKALLQRNDLHHCTCSMLLYCLAHSSICDSTKRELKEALFSKAITMLSMKLGHSEDLLRTQVANSEFSDSEYNKELEKLWNVNDTNAKQKLEHFLQLSLLHTMMVCNAIESRDSDILVKHLKKNSNFRLYNRQHQLLYYKDVTIKGEDINHPLRPGADTVDNQKLDCKKTMNYLGEKLSGDSKSKYALYDYDRYTLCDLIISRIDTDNQRSFFNIYKQETNAVKRKQQERLIQNVCNYLLLVLQVPPQERTAPVSDKTTTNHSTTSNNDTAVLITELKTLAKSVTEETKTPNSGNNA